MNRHRVLLFASLALACPALASAQTTAPEEAAQFPEDGDATEVEEIVVTGARERGAVIGDIEPEIQLDARDVRALGAGTVSELIEQLAPQLQSGRGRGEGRPIILLNGRRISGFAEVRDLPPEAIQRIDILPEEVALKYGYRADQRVMNIVLRERFRAVTTEASLALPTQGGRLGGDASANVLRINRDGRTSLDVRARGAGSILESERDITPTPSRADIVVAPDGAIGTVDQARFRTLTPETDTLALNGTLNRSLSDEVSATLNARLERSASEGLLGLPFARLTLADGRRLDRYDDLFGPLRRETEITTAELGAVADGRFSPDWRWTATANYDRVETETATGRGLDSAALQTGLEAGSLDPFGPPPGDLALLRDRARSVNQSGSAEFVVSGAPLRLPAGPLSTSFKLQAEARRFESASNRSGARSRAELTRERGELQANIDAPVAGRGVLEAVGDLTINANLALEELSDFGSLRTVGAGLNWRPVEALGVIASVTDEAGAPSVDQLGDPVVLTPNVPVFDFATGRTVDVVQLAGGNPLLVADSRRVVKLGLTFKPFEDRDLTLRADYTRSRIDDPIASFPTITPEIEAAFPDRFLRDADGTLVQIDSRPVNFARADQEQVRWGFNWSKRLAPPARAAQGDGARLPPFGGGERPPWAGPRGGGRGGFGGGGPFGGGRPGEGRLQLAAFHTWRLQDSILIRDGVPELDLLNGSAVGSGGGVSEHEVDVQAGVFRNGLGARLEADWRSGTSVRGVARPGSAGDLVFEPFSTVNLRLFADLGQRRDLVRRRPWLRGARVSLALTNLFDARQEVRDATGAVPISYEADRLDPVGRAVRLSIRKLFLPRFNRADRPPRS